MSDGDICLKFGVWVDKRQKRKPEVELRFVGPIYFENGNAYNSAARYDIGTKFGLQVENGIPQRTT